MENVSCAGWQRSVGTEIQGERVVLAGRDHTGRGKEVGWDAGCLETLENPRWVAFPFLKKNLFLGRPFLRSLLIVTILVLFYYWGWFFFFGHEACGILVPQPEIEPTPLALEGQVLTTGPP